MREADQTPGCLESIISVVAIIHNLSWYITKFLEDDSVANNKIGIEREKSGVGDGVSSLCVIFFKVDGPLQEEPRACREHAIQQAEP